MFANKLIVIMLVHTVCCLVLVVGAISADTDFLFDESKKPFLSDRRFTTDDERQLDTNEINPQHYGGHNSTEAVCAGGMRGVRAARARLLAWGHALDTQTRRQQYVLPVAPPGGGCRREALVMFSHLDKDNNNLLSREEFYSLTHAVGEPCVALFINHCEQRSQRHKRRKSLLRTNMEANEPNTAIEFDKKLTDDTTTDFSQTYDLYDKPALANNEEVSQWDNILHDPDEETEKVYKRSVREHSFIYKRGNKRSKKTIKKALDQTDVENENTDGEPVWVVDESSELTESSNIDSVEERSVLKDAKSGGLTVREWCGCMRGAKPPCFAARQFSTAWYRPACDARGYFLRRQCAGSRGGDGGGGGARCWCVSSAGAREPCDRTAETTTDADGLLDDDDEDADGSGNGEVLEY